MRLHVESTTTSSRCSRALRSWSTFASCSSGTVIRSSRSTGAVRWLRPTTIRDTSSRAPSRRPHARRGRGPRCRSRRPVANRRLHWNARTTASLPGPRRAARAGSRTQGRAPRSAAAAGRWPAPGLRPPVPTATTRSERRITDIIVKEQLAGSSALFDPHPGRLARREHRRVDARDRRWRSARARRRRDPTARNSRSIELAAAGVDPGPNLGRDARRDDHDLRARGRAAARSCGPRCARRPPPRPGGRGRAG